MFACVYHLENCFRSNRWHKRDPMGLNSPSSWYKPARKTVTKRSLSSFQPWTVLRPSVPCSRRPALCTCVCNTIVVSSPRLNQSQPIRTCMSRCEGDSLPCHRMIKCIEAGGRACDNDDICVLNYTLLLLDYYYNRSSFILIKQWCTIQLDLGLVDADVDRCGLQAPTKLLLLSKGFIIWILSLSFNCRY